jgi:hypothetical protein
VKNNIAKEFEKLAASGAVIDATKDIAKFTVKMTSNFGGKAGDPTAGLSNVGGSGVELARKVGNAVNKQGEALLKEVDNLYALVQSHSDQCKEEPVRVAGDPSASLGSDPFLQVLGSIAEASKKTFAQLLWGQWITNYAYTTTQVCIDDNCRPKMEDNVEGFFAWWGDLTKNIEEQAGDDFGLQARLKTARDEWEKKKDDE